MKDTESEKKSAGTGAAQRIVMFRVWDKWEQKMWNPVTFFDFCRGVPSNWQDGYILMQYTGLKDRNGRMIFEGDIVKTGGNNIFTVTYRLEYAQFCLGLNMWLNVRGGIEIIGNIFENPELIEDAESGT